MEEVTVRKLFIEHLERRYQKPYTETCWGGSFDLKFFPTETSGQKCKHRSTWIARFYPEPIEIFEGNSYTHFLTMPVEIYLDDETGEIWEPVDPYKKLTPQEKRVARKKRRQARRNRD